MRTTFLGIVLIMLLAGMSVAAFEMQENRTFEAGNKWTVGNPPDDDFSSIQEAVCSENVSDGDVLNVRWKQSWYNEYVHVNKTLTIRHHPDESPEPYPTVVGFNVCAPGVEISEFTVRSGITLSANSSNAVIHNNNLTQSPYDGIYIGPESYNNTLAQNNVSCFAIEPTGDIEHFIQNISETNMIDGKPIYYWVNHRDERIPAKAGYVALVNAENITVENLSWIRSNECGVLIVNSTDISVTNVTFKSHTEAVRASSSSRITMKSLKFQSPYYIDYWCVVLANVNDSCIWKTTFDIDIVPVAIKLENSHNNTIKENVGVSVTRDEWTMIYLDCSHGNSIENNVLRNDGEAGGTSHLLYLKNSCNNTLIGNSFANAQFGLYLSMSNSNLIVHNNFIGNEHDLYLGSSVDNKLDNGLEGNYWVAYNGIDDDGDGIDNDAYVTPEFTDNCPLNKTWSEYGMYERLVEGGPPSGSTLLQRLYTFSNATLGWAPQGFTFNRKSGEITLKVTCGGPAFFNVTIPRNWIDWSFNVSADDVPRDDYLFTPNATCHSIYLLLAQGRHIVKIAGLEVGSFPGDLNYDSVVDVLDAIILANYFGAEEDP